MTESLVSDDKVYKAAMTFLAFIASANILLSKPWQAFTWTNVGLFLLGTLIITPSTSSRSNEIYFYAGELTLNRKQFVATFL